VDVERINNELAALGIGVDEALTPAQRQSWGRTSGRPRRMSVHRDRSHCSPHGLSPPIHVPLELGIFAREDHRHAVLVARLDNLGMGAAGTAIQNPFMTGCTTT
jgi:hypothetical protein